MHNNISFTTTDGTTLRGWHYTPTVPASIPLGDCAWLLRREGNVSRQVRRRVRSGGLRVSRLRQPQFRRERRPTTPGNRSMAPNQGLFGRHHIRAEPGSDRLARIGVWGSSYSGAHVLVVAATDRRVKRRVAGARDQRVTGLSTTGACRLHRPSRSATPCGPCQPRRRWRPCDASRGGGRYHSAIALPTADFYQWFTQTAASRAPSWRNEVTLRTIEYAFGYEPGAYIGLISPTPRC